MSEQVLHASALLLDFDGVLVDSVPAVERAWGEWAGEHGLDPAAVIATAHGVRTVETVRAMAPHLDAEAEAQRIEDREVGLTDGVTAYAGAAALLARLPDDAWAIVTSGTRKLAGARLAATGLPEPRVFVTADDVAHGKPAPDPYLLAAQRLDARPRACVVVEDSPAGVRAARSAGMRVIALTTSHDPADFSDPTVVAAAIAAVTVTPDGDGLRITVRTRP